MMYEDNPVRVKRAALVVELENGTRMIYAMHEPITIAFEPEYETRQYARVLESVLPQTFLEIRGVATGGRIWEAEMPGDGQAEIEPSRQEIQP